MSHRIKLDWMCMYWCRLYMRRVTLLVSRNVEERYGGIKKIYRMHCKIKQSQGSVSLASLKLSEIHDTAKGQRFYIIFLSSSVCLSVSQQHLSILWTTN